MLVRPTLAGLPYGSYLPHDRMSTRRPQLGARLGLAASVGLAVAAAAATTCLCGCGSKAPPPAPPPPEVIVAQAVQQDVPIRREWVGTTDGYVNAKVHPRGQGYLLKRNYQEGSLVKAGQLLFTIDARPYQAALDQSKADLLRNQANLQKTKLDVTRYTPLAKEGAVSQEELDNAVQSHRANQAAVAASQAAVRTAALNLSWTRVTAPISGIAGIAVAEVGDLVSETTLLTTVSQVNPIKVVFPISEIEYLWLARRMQQTEAAQPSGQAGQRGKRAAEGERPPSRRASADEMREEVGDMVLILGDGTQHPYKGKSSFIDRQVDQRTGTMTVKVTFPNPELIIRPGQYAKVRAPVDIIRNAVVVPQRAIAELQGMPQVVVVGAGNQAEFRTIKTGPTVGALTVVSEGLRPGELVVVEGLQRLKPGAVVSPKRETKAGATPAASTSAPAAPAAHQPAAGE